MIKLEYVFHINVNVDRPIEVGRVGKGVRKIIPITGGDFDGETLQGKILPGGADYQIIRSDGVTELIAQYTLQTEDGTFINVTNQGYRHGPKDIIEKLAKGIKVPDDSYYFKTTPVFEVDNEKFAFLNRNIFIGVGTREPSHVKIAYYQVL